MNREDKSHRPLVLLVDPHDDRRTLYGNWFVSLGLEFVCAADALVGFAIAKAYQPELIVTELRLRRSDGLQFIRQLQAAAATRHIPILVVTATTAPEAVNAALAGGAVAVFPALSEFEVLREQVASILAHAPTRCAKQRRRVALGATLNGSLTDGTES